MFQVNVAPDMGMYSLLRSQGYDPAYALAEFIDNAIHAYQIKWPERRENGIPLKVTLKFYGSDYRGENSRPNCIAIEDDGPGIAGIKLADALKPAKHSDTRGLSEFGIGMKAAAVWFADTWSLSTCPVAESQRYELTFDLKELLEAGRETLLVTDVYDDKRQKGTVITLNDLRMVINVERFKDICDSLKELYQLFTAGELPRLQLIASFNETPINLRYSPQGDKAILHAPIYKTVTKKLYAIGNSRSWRVEISTIFNGHQVQGFICLLETGSYKTNPGLVLFRRDRVICGTVKQPFIPVRLFGTSNKFAKQRLYGELHMDDMPVTYTKDKFEFNEDEFIDQILSNREVVELASQAEEYRTDKVKVPPIVVANEMEITSKNRAALADASTQKSLFESQKEQRYHDGDTTPQPSQSSQEPQATFQEPQTTIQEPQTAFQEPQTTMIQGPQATPQGPQVIQQDPVVETKPLQADFRSLLKDLKNQTQRLMLREIIDETIYQYGAKRYISTALCFRMVLELGVLFKIERDFPGEYAKVSEKGIKAVITFMHKNNAIFFDSTTHRVAKCVQGITDGQQQDVVLLNNTGHGHYQPSRSELDLIAVNMEQLLRWAYS